MPGGHEPWRREARDRGYRKQIESEEEQRGRRIASYEQKRKVKKLKDIHEQHRRNMAQVELVKFEISMIKYALKTGDALTKQKVEGKLRDLDRIPISTAGFLGFTVPKDKHGKRQWKKIKAKNSLYVAIFGEKGWERKKTKDKKGRLTDFGEDMKKRLGALEEELERAERIRDEYKYAHDSEIDLYEKEFKPDMD